MSGSSGHGSAPSLKRVKSAWDNSDEYTAAPQKEGEEVATKGEESLACRTRRGSILSYQTILKCDHFPGSQSNKFEEIIDDVPNFRQVVGCNVFGVGQPGIEGYKRVLQRVLQTEGVNKVIWMNLREEPFVYINGKPFCVKNRITPFTNLICTGIEAKEREALEERLVEEIQSESSQQFGGKIGKILCHGETKPEGTGLHGEPAIGKPYCFWENMNLDSATTVLEVSNRLIREGFPLVFHRVPISDENAPEMKDFDEILRCLSSADASTAVVFNCQMGRGRTTTGMVLAVMLQDWILRKAIPFSKMPNIPVEQEFVFAAVAKLNEYVKPQSTALVELAMDRCSHMQHLRTAILAKRGTKHEPVGMAYLERYIFLVLFMEYVLLQTEQSDVFSLPLAGQCFEHWLANHECRGAIFNILDHLTLD